MALSPHYWPFKADASVVVFGNDPKFSDRYAWANSADLEEQSDQGLHCLLFRLHHLDSLLYGRAT